MQPEKYVVWWYGPGLPYNEDAGACALAMTLEGNAVSATLPAACTACQGDYTADVYAILTEGGYVQRLAGGSNGFRIASPIVSARLKPVQATSLAGQQFQVEVRAADTVTRLSARNNAGSALKETWTVTDNHDGTKTWTRTYTADTPAVGRYWIIQAWIGDAMVGMAATDAIDIDTAQLTLSASASTVQTGEDVTFTVSSNLAEGTATLLADGQYVLGTIDLARGGSVTYAFSQSGERRIQAKAGDTLSNVLILQVTDAPAEEEHVHQWRSWRNDSYQYQPCLSNPAQHYLKSYRHTELCYSCGATDTQLREFVELTAIKTEHTFVSSPSSASCMRICSACDFIEYSHQWNKKKTACTVCGLTLEAMREAYLTLLNSCLEQGLDPAENVKLISIAYDRKLNAEDPYAREFALGFFDYVGYRSMFGNFSSGGTDYDPELSKALIDISCLAYENDLLPELALMGFKDAVLIEPSIEVALFGLAKGHGQTVLASMENSAGEPVVLLAFRGTEMNGDFNQDLVMDFEFVADANGIHQGFAKYATAAYVEANSVRFSGITGNPSLNDLIARAANGEPVHFILTGHSLGGAMAQVFYYTLVKDKHVPSEQITLYTYASPCPFKQNVDSTGLESSTVYNVINPYDTVPTLGASIKSGKRIGWSILIGTEEQAERYATENFLYPTWITSHASTLYRELVHEDMYMDP